MTIASPQAVTKSQVRNARLAGMRPKFATHYAGKPYEYTEPLSVSKPDQMEDLEAAQNYRAATQEGIQFV